MRIAVDAMGGDNAPAQVLQGATEAAGEYGIEILAVGSPGAADVDHQIRALRKPFIGMTARADCEAQSVVGGPKHCGTDGFGASGYHTHAWRNLSSLVERAVIFAEVFVRRNQNHILFWIEQRLQRCNRQTGLGFGLANGKQRTTDNQMRR